MHVHTPYVGTYTCTYACVCFVCASKPLTLLKHLASSRNRRLFQQFVVTAAARYELKRMETLATPKMQKQLRAESYDQLKGALRNGEQPADIGRRVVCPASVKGSRRAMYKLFLDCMAIVRKFGSPHLFITVTCNQGHRHVRASILKGQSPDERADIVNRFFAKQVDLLLEYIHAGKAFGELCAYCYVIEYQKRGNPHMHMVIRLKDGPLTAEEYDQYVCARLPPGPPFGNLSKDGACWREGCCCREGHAKDSCGCGASSVEACTCDSVLWHAVLKHMTHVCSYDSPCRDSSTGRCKYMYDQERYTPVTMHAAKKRPEYRRVAPDALGGRFAHKMVRGVGGAKVKVRITDSQVVPYNPKLLLAPVGFEYEFAPRSLDAHEDGLILSKLRERYTEDDAWHSNVEISSNPTANIKYLYMYFCKGEDRLICSVDDGDADEDGAINECKKHLNSQHYSPESSVWKLLGLKMNRQSHRCETLMLAYPGREYIHFDPDASTEDVEASADAQAGRNHTQAFFDLNASEACMYFRPSQSSSALSVDINGEESSTHEPTEEQTLQQYLGPPTGDLYPHAAKLKYEEIPYYYTYDQKESQWCRRSSPHMATNVVTRIVVIKPSAGDLFYMRLRLLFDCCKGCQSYKDLQTSQRGEADEKVCDTFQEACILDGLVADDAEWHAVLSEAQLSVGSNGLIALFVEILMNCEPQRADELWETFKDAMAQDTAKANGRAEDPNASDHNEALRQIRDQLQDFPGAKTLADFGLPEVDDSDLPTSTLPAELRAERLLFENKQAYLFNRYEAKLHQMNDQQRETWAVLKTDIDAVTQELKGHRPSLSSSHRANAGSTSAADAADAGAHEDTGPLPPPRARAHFIYARGGFGKTFLDEVILDYVRAHEGYALAMASSGIASLLLEGARTVHSRLKVPLEITEGQMLGFGKHQVAARLIKEAVLLLWDECTMLSKEVLEIIDRSLRDLMGNDLPFGGKLFIFTGDWAQTLPVAKSRFATVSATHLQSDLWECVTQHELTVNERVRQCQLRGDPQQAAAYAEWDAFLSKVGAGACGSGVVSCDGSPHDAAKLMRLPDSIVFESQELSDFVNEIYPGVEHNYTDAEWLKGRAILAPKNEDVDAINAEVMRRLPGDERNFVSADSTTDDTSGLWSTDILNTFEPAGMPPHELKLKQGCVVMLLRNLHATRGLCNGTRLIVVKMTRNTLVCRILTGRKDSLNNLVVIPRVKLQSAKGELPCTLTRLQFPVRVAFGMTINKVEDAARTQTVCLPLPLIGARSCTSFSLSHDWHLLGSH